MRTWETQLELIFEDTWEDIQVRYQLTEEDMVYIKLAFDEYNPFDQELQEQLSAIVTATMHARLGKDLDLEHIANCLDKGDTDESHWK